MHHSIHRRARISTYTYVEIYLYELCTSISYVEIRARLVWLYCIHVHRMNYSRYRVVFRAFWYGIDAKEVMDVLQ